MAAAASDDAVRLVSCDAAGALHLERDAEAWLRSKLPAAPVGVLSVTGPMRSGKSSLLNELLSERTFRTSLPGTLSMGGNYPS